MKLKGLVFTILILSSLLLGACGAAQPPIPTSEVMMEENKPGNESVMKTEDGSMTEDSGEMMEKTQEGMMEKTEESMPSKDNMDGDGEMAMDQPVWFGAELTDVTSGENFTISSLKGKVILVETMAVWCSNCFKQQNQVKALHEALGMRDDFVSIGLDIDPNEDAAILKEFVERNGFDWKYAVSPEDVSRELSNLYGAQFLNPPSTPMLVIDRKGEVHPLPFGIKSSDKLMEILQPFLDTEM